MVICKFILDILEAEPCEFDPEEIVQVIKKWLQKPSDRIKAAEKKVATASGIQKK